MKQCVLCKREGDDDLFERHHLYPGKKRRKSEETIWVCVTCGDQIHNMFSNQELRDTYNTADSLKSGMQSYINFIKKKPITSRLPMAKKKRRR